MLINEFASDSDASLMAKASKQPERPFSEKEREELVLASKATSAAADKASKDGSIQVTLELSERVANYVWQVVAPIKQRTFLAEMALAYLVSHIEAFIKDYVAQVLVDNPRMLKSGAALTQEEALAFGSMKALRSGLAQREVDALGYGSIDEVATFFQKRLGISLQSFKSWEALREHIYRRNLIVHNQGRVNDIYRKKVQYKGTRVRLHTDMKYVSSAAETMTKFVDFIHEQTTHKLKLVKA